MFQLFTNDLFCGAGGMGLGFQKAGYEVAGAWDFDKWAVKSYAHNVDPIVLQADIQNMTWRDMPKAAVWTFGFPCQDLSIAGKKAGLIEGKRSKLFFQVMRLLEETEAFEPDNLPAVILAENVKQLKPVLGVLEEEYDKRGYNTYVKLYNSKYWGVAQSRERYFVVGIRKDLDDGSFEFPTEDQNAIIPKLSSVLEHGIEDKFYLSDDKAVKIIDQALLKLETLGNCHATLTPDRVDRRQQGRRSREDEEPSFTLTAQDLHGIIVDEVAVSQAETGIQVLGMLEGSGTTQEHNNRVHDPAGVSPTLTAVSGGTHHIKIFDYYKYRVRKLTPREYARLQGFPESFQFVVSNSQLYRQFGNAVTVNVAEAVATAIKTFLEGLNNENN
jgi:DNA (cytosine-5)-methyltransferase 1